MAWIDIGTDNTLSAWRCAVTTISGMPPVSAANVGAANAGSTNMEVAINAVRPP
jgi:hypothetical protein